MLSKKDNLRILAIETSCDETAAAVIESSDKNIAILSNIVSSQIDIHKKFGGVFPEIASRAHAEQIIPVIRESLQVSGVRLKVKEENLKLKPQTSNLSTIDLIAVTSGPGLIGSLLIGVNAAKTLAYANKKPIMGINHWLGHIYSCFTREKSKIKNQKSKLPEFPLIALIVSGGHTGLVYMKSHTEIETIGQTLDDAAGEAFDKVAKILGLGYPGGPAISKAAANFKIQNLKCDPKGKINLEFPRSMLDRKDSFDFSFSGLKTSVLYKVRDLEKTYKIDEIKNQIAYEFQQCVIDILIGKTLQSVEKYKPKSVLLCGGVSANKQLREQMAGAIQNLDINFFVPPMELTGDNAAMIGLAAAYQIASGVNPTTYENINTDSNLKLL